jgi:hypothetical protein
VAVRIICINKAGGDHSDPHVAITNYGWINEYTSKKGRNDRNSMVDWVENKNGRAYVKDAEGEINCYVNISRAGTKFLQTYADNRWTDNLLKLPEC